MNKNLAEYLHIIKMLKPNLQRDFNVSDISVFGSFVRGEEKRGSDLDVLVTFTKTPDLFNLAKLSLFLEEKLGIKIDLVPNLNLKPHIAQNIFAEKIDIV